MGMEGVSQVPNQLGVSVDRCQSAIPSFDPINLFTPVQEFFLPLGRDQTNTTIGLWFDTVGLLHIYLQQAIVPDNIYTQVKIVTLRLPVGLGFLISNSIQSMFYARAFILAIRAATAATTIEVQKLVDQLLERIRNKA
ncbi:MAG TPA: hypothetical protein VFF14_09540, partial [Candidatus Deferrimicrobium sp.]|nr:hypothetical protein [Candidatus Deferrimicrobium sp.]